MIGRSVSTVGRVWRSGRGDLKIFSAYSRCRWPSFASRPRSSSWSICTPSRGLARDASRSTCATGPPTSRSTCFRMPSGKTEGVESMRFVSRADARNDMVNDGTSSSLAALPLEAFPASFELKLRDDVTDGQVAAIAQKLRAVPSVDAVETYERWTERLTSLLKGGVMASVILGFVVLAAAISVIGATMRLALHRRQIEVEVLKLVGATDRFGAGPFLVEGACQGGSVRACCSLLGVLYLVVLAVVSTTIPRVAPGGKPYLFALGNRGRDDCLGGLARRSFGVCWRATARFGLTMLRRIFPLALVALALSGLVRAHSSRRSIAPDARDFGLGTGGYEQALASLEQDERDTEGRARGAQDPGERDRAARHRSRPDMYRLVRVGLSPVGGGFGALASITRAKWSARVVPSRKMFKRGERSARASSHF